MTWTLRTKLASIAAILLIVGGLQYVSEPSSSPHYFSGAALKVGLISFLAWLAYPQLIRLPRVVTWVVAGVAVAGMMFSPTHIASNLRVLVLLGPLIAIFFLFSRRVKE